MPSAHPPVDPAIPWRLRTDLVIQAAESDSGSSWTIKDPLRLKYFNVEMEEMMFLRLLDGSTSLSSLMAVLRDRFPDVEFSLDNLRQFLMTAVNGGLLRACVPGHSDRLMEIRNRQESQAIFRRMLSLLTFRLRGFDPTRLLETLDSAVGWIFHWPFLVTGLACCVFAATLVFARQSQLEIELPGITSLFTAANLPFLVASILFVKVIHELGHGVTCRHFGGECHELGILFVGFIPLLYCDVSDSWLQQDRRKRMLVAAAGIFTELFLAAVCAFLWSISRTGFLHTFFLNVMIVTSLNTLIINGNPLLKYDGYYVVSDLFRIPNLAGESRAVAAGFFDRVVLGLPDRFRASRSLFTHSAMIVYGAASMGYRLLIVTGLVWFMHRTLKEWNLEFITGFLITSVAAGILISVVGGVADRTRAASTSSERRRRAITGVAVLGTMLLICVLVPFPYSVRAPFTLTAGVCIPVYALEDGMIHSQIHPGQSVQAGDVIAILENDEISMALARAEGEQRIAEVRVAALAAQRSTSREASDALPAAEKSLRSREARVLKLRQKLHDLTVVSPVNGLIFPPRNRPRPHEMRTQGSLWFGEPLSSENESAWISRQTLLCWVGQYKELRANCLLSQMDIELIDEGAAVDLIFSSQPGNAVSGRVTQRNSIPEQSVDRELVANRLVMVKSSESSRPVETLFAVAMEIDGDGSTSPASLYCTGSAKIHCKPASLARRAWRFVCYTFTFHK
jgi:putative peptide zinc metalloprotease protein